MLVPDEGPTRNYYSVPQLRGTVVQPAPALRLPPRCARSKQRETGSARGESTLIAGLSLARRRKALLMMCAVWW